MVDHKHYSMVNDMNHHHGYNHIINNLCQLVYLLKLLMVDQLHLINPHINLALNQLNLLNSFQFVVVVNVSLNLMHSQVFDFRVTFLFIIYSKFNLYLKSKKRKKTSMNDLKKKKKLEIT